MIRVGASGNLDAVKTLIGAGAYVNQLDEVSYERSLKDILRVVVELELHEKKSNYYFNTDCYALLVA